MTSPAHGIGTGITIEFKRSGFTAEILDVTPPGRTREAVDVSHQLTVGAQIFLPKKLHDPGELSFDIQFNPDTDPPIDQAPEEIVLTFPSTATWTFQGFMTGYEPSTPIEDKMTASVTVKVSGAVVPVAGVGGSGSGSGSGSGTGSASGSGSGA